MPILNTNGTVKNIAVGQNAVNAMFFRGNMIWPLNNHKSTYTFPNGTTVTSDRYKLAYPKYIGNYRFVYNGYVYAKNIGKIGKVSYDPVFAYVDKHTRRSSIICLRGKTLTRITTKYTNEYTTEIVEIVESNQSGYYKWDYILCSMGHSRTLGEAIGGATEFDSTQKVVVGKCNGKMVAHLLDSDGTETELKDYGQTNLWFSAGEIVFDGNDFTVYYTSDYVDYYRDVYAIDIGTPYLQNTEKITEKLFGPYLWLCCISGDSIMDIHGGINVENRNYQHIEMTNYLVYIADNTTLLTQNAGDIPLSKFSSKPLHLLGINSGKYFIGCEDNKIYQVQSGEVTLASDVVFDELSHNFIRKGPYIYTYDDTSGSFIQKYDVREYGCNLWSD